MNSQLPKKMQKDNNRCTTIDWFLYICKYVRWSYIQKLKIMEWHFLPFMWYGDGAGNTDEANSSVFSLIQMR